MELCANQYILQFNPERKNMAHLFNKFKQQGLGFFFKWSGSTFGIDKHSAMFWEQTRRFSEIDDIKVDRGKFQDLKISS